MRLLWKEGRDALNLHQLFKLVKHVGQHKNKTGDHISIRRNYVTQLQMYVIICQKCSKQKLRASFCDYNSFILLI